MSSARYDLGSYGVKIELPIHWGEMDAFDHVNNVNYFRYFESARIAYFMRVGIGTSLADAKLAPILAETSCRYRFPLRFPDSVTVAARTLTYTDTELHMEYLVWSQTKDNAAAVGTGRVVCFDFEAGSRCRFPDSVLNAVRALDPLSQKKG